MSFYLIFFQNNRSNFDIITSKHILKIVQCISHLRNLRNLNFGMVCVWINFINVVFGQFTCLYGFSLHIIKSRISHIQFPLKDIKTKTYDEGIKTENGMLGSYISKMFACVFVLNFWVWQIFKFLFVEMFRVVRFGVPVIWVCQERGHLLHLTLVWVVFYVELCQNLDVGFVLHAIWVHPGLNFV